MSQLQKKLLYSLKAAWPTTLKSAKWLLKLMIPISLVVALLQHFGIIEWIAQYLNPVFQYMGLPGASAVIFITGATAGTYAGVAAMMSIPLTLRQATIICLMIALCHALPMECAVCKKTGSSFFKMGIIRIIMAFMCAYYLNIVLPDMPEAYAYMGAVADSSLMEVLYTWGLSQIKMVVMVFGIIYSLMVLQRLIEAYNLLPKLSEFFAPLMHVFGLSRQATYMWLVGNVLGLSYGSAVMLELEEKGVITRKEANDVNYHLIMNHSMLEDTIVFAVTGISAFWIISTRVLFAMLLVWGRILVKVILKK